MSAPAASFLRTLVRAVAAVGLYGQQHPYLARALDIAYAAMMRASAGKPLVVTFLMDEVRLGTGSVRELRGWPWAERLVRAGVERLEIPADPSPDEFARFVAELAARLNSAAHGTLAMPASEGRFRLRRATEGLPAQEGVVFDTATLPATLDEELETLRWLHDEVARVGVVPLLEAESLVRTLFLVMHGGAEVSLPAIRRAGDADYTVPHALNVAVLTMGLAESLGCWPAEVDAVGLAALVHDIGKVHIRPDVLNKSGTLTAEERLIVETHTTEGAKIILRSDGHLDLAAVVAYEHHVTMDGGGYPRWHYPRACHWASRLVQVCDVYDALRTSRPYREASTQEGALAYLARCAGSMFDLPVVDAFAKMVRDHGGRIADQASQFATSPAPAREVG
jgi:putative nucleotidyltransferase with HDIG domain